MLSYDKLIVDERSMQAICLFKTESKSIFLDIQKRKDSIGLDIKDGIEFSTIEKGCLVLNHKEEKGFHVFIFDNVNRGEEAQYWRDNFLTLSPLQDGYHQTRHMLSLTKKFITGKMKNEMNLSKEEEIGLLHKSIDYFKGNDKFDITKFQAEVFSDNERIKAFQRFGGLYNEVHDIDITSQFDISNEAVKKQSRAFKSVLKLDKNFHIYIHGRTDLIEKGVDKSGKKFYKIYYEDEK